MALLINWNGDSEPYLPANGKEFTLKELQDAVGGDIQALYLDDGRIMLINEEGKLLNLPFNDAANTLARILSDLMPDDYIVGTALICSDKEFA